MSRVFVARENALRRHGGHQGARTRAGGRRCQRERFKREITLAARLQHPNIVPLLAAGLAGAALYYTMPFVDGESLRERIDRERPMAFDDITGILAGSVRARSRTRTRKASSIATSSRRT